MFGDFGEHSEHWGEFSTVDSTVGGQSESKFNSGVGRMKLFSVEEYSEVFRILEATKNVLQDEQLHPEGDVYVHSLQTFIKAFRESWDIDLLLAALLHDVGKQISSHDHEQHGEELLKDYVSVKTLWLIRNHMRVWYYLLGQMSALEKCKQLAGHPWFGELCQLARFDKIARIVNWNPKINQENIVQMLGKAAMNRWVGWEGW